MDDERLVATVLGANIPICHIDDHEYYEMFKYFTNFVLALSQHGY